MVEKYWKTEKNDHDLLTDEQAKNFLRQHRTGIDNLGRIRLAQILSHMPTGTTVLDAACGSAVNYDVLKQNRIHEIIKYTGV